MNPRIMIGQVPEALGSSSSGAPNEQINQNAEPFGSSSAGASNGQTSNSKEQVPTTDVLAFASHGDKLDNNLELNSGAKNINADNDGCAKSDDTRRKRYHRHTAHQIQAMEAFFKHCPNPGERERIELSRELGMEPLQVKFWFQNKRTHIKAQGDRMENNQLRAQNQMLRANNLRIREALARSSCLSCGSPQAVPHTPIQANDLRIENASLRQEINRRFFGIPVVNLNPNVPPQLDVASVQVPSEHPDASAFGGEMQPNAQGGVFDEEGGLITSMGESNVPEKQLIINLANAAMHELTQMTQMDYPLWIPSVDLRQHMLNEVIYDYMFPRIQGFATPLSFRVEATRDTDVIMMNQMDLVDVMMNTEKFAAVFSSMVSRASLLDAIITGNEVGYDGILIVVNAEYQVLTPTIPTRESTFARYCKKLENDIWVVVDVSIEDMYKTLAQKKCHRMPSGCVIQAFPNGSSRVTWIEHVEVLDNEDVHPVAKPFLDSGLTFGAQKWLTVLARQYERLAVLTFPNFHHADINTTVALTDPHPRKNILKLADKMVKTFCNGVTSSNGHSCSWKQNANDDEEVRIITKTTNIEPGKPFGSVVCVTTSFWIPVQHEMVFEFLRDESTRKEWDIFARIGYFHEFLHITNGNNVGNCVSMLQLTDINTEPGMVILQDYNTDGIFSSVIYAPIDPLTVQLLLSGGTSDNVELLPSGFTMYPSRRPLLPLKGLPNEFDNSKLGSLVTAAFQVLIDPSASTASPFSFGSVAFVNYLIESTMERLKFALLSKFV